MQDALGRKAIHAALSSLASICSRSFGRESVWRLPRRASTLERLSILLLECRSTLEESDECTAVDRALNIYGALADRRELEGMRERLSRHLMKRYIEGERDEHRLTVEGLSYLRILYREMDSRN